MPTRNYPTRIERSEDLELLEAMLDAEAPEKTMTDVETVEDLIEVLGPCPVSALAGPLAVPGEDSKMENRYQELHQLWLEIDASVPEWEDVCNEMSDLWDRMSEDSRKEVSVGILWERVGGDMSSQVHQGFGSQDSYGNSVHQVGDEASGFQYEIRSVGRPTELTDDENGVVYEFLTRHVDSLWDAEEDSDRRGPPSFRWNKRG